MAQLDTAQETPVAAGAARDWNWHPDLPIPTNPLFAWPPRPLAAAKWLAGSWLAVSATLVELVLAVAVYFALQPSWEIMQSLAPGWVLQVWLRNMALIFLIAGGLKIVYDLLLYRSFRKADVR